MASLLSNTRAPVISSRCHQQKKGVEVQAGKQRKTHAVNVMKNGNGIQVTGFLKYSKVRRNYFYLQFNPPVVVVSGSFVVNLCRNFVTTFSVFGPSKKLRKLEWREIN